MQPVSEKNVYYWCSFFFSSFSSPSSSLGLKDNFLLIYNLCFQENIHLMIMMLISVFSICLFFHNLFSITGV